MTNEDKQVGRAIPPSFLSRLPLSGREGIYAIHKKVYEAVPASSRPLWRRCNSYALVLARAPAVGFPSRPFDPAPRNGRICRFDLLAEVASAKKVDGAKRGRRVDRIIEARNSDPSRPYAEIAREVGASWLARRSARCGFEIVSLHRVDYEVIDFVRRGNSVRVGAVRFAGVLRVTDQAAMRDTLLNGIGHSKAWGCGLLLCLR